LEDSEDSDVQDDGIDSRCLDRFHRIRTLRKLREAYMSVGAEIFDRLHGRFGSVRDCGFTIDEILHADLDFIKRDEEQAPPPRRRQRTGDDDSAGGAE
jgi:hypothetical protein